MQVASHFVAFIAASAAALCVVQALPVAYNLSSGGCRSREYAVDEAVKHASGQEYCECVCRANAPWRCDCSGLVSRAWGLSAPGLTTYDFHPNYCEKLGSRSELEPADSLLWPGVESQGTGHVVMFVKWVDKVSIDGNNEARALIPLAQSAGLFEEAACHSPSIGCTNGQQHLSYYGDSFSPCRARKDIVCP